MLHKPKPISNQRPKGPSIWRIPPEEPLTPGLRVKDKEFVRAIGFNATITEEE